MKRTPIRPRTASMSESELIAYYMREREKAQAATDRAVERLKARRKPVERPDWTIAGKPWPSSFMTEAKFQAHVESVAHGYGWKTSHAHNPFFDDAGWPDLAMVCTERGRNRFLVAELKVRSEKQGTWRKPKGEQAEWISYLALAGVDVRVWVWPDSDDEIYAELAR